MPDTAAMRLFVDAPLHAGAAVDATPAQAHHLGPVMRRGPGDSVRLFNGRDGEWAARIEALRKGRAVLRVEGPLRPQAPEPGPALVFAPLKRDATDLVAEKATELGATALYPVLTERTVAGRVNLERLAAIATGAAEQCERLTVPQVHPLGRLLDLLGTWPADRPLAAALERSDAPPVRAPAAGLLVGPEGGFAGAELDVLASRPFVVPVSLGPRVLRAETAAIAGLALLQAQGPY